MSWRTTMSSPDTSTDGSVVGAGVGTSDVFYWERVLASFIAKSSAALTHPYFYLIRTNTQWSLCQLSGLSPINYSALLLECKLVQTRANLVDDSRNVRFDRKNWIAFLDRYGLRGDAEVTDGKIYHRAIFEDRDDGGAYTARMPLLRVGKVRPGNSPPSNTAINSGIEHTRTMGFSVTPKMHGMESHVVRQMRTIPGGIGMLMEHLIEHYHQTGCRFDLAYCRVGSLVGQAAIRSSVEKRGQSPRVQLNKMLLQKSFVGIRKRRSAAIKSEEKKIQIKDERREHALAKISATIELDKKEAILAKLKVEEDMEDLDELAELEKKLFGNNIDSSGTPP